MERDDRQTLNLRPPEPTTIAGWEDLAARLLESARSIEQQLGSRHVEIGGVRMDGVAYWEWRRRAVGALNSRKKAYERAKRQAHALRVAEQERFQNAPLDDAGELLRPLFRLACRWARRGVADPDDEDHDLLSRTKAYLERATGAAAPRRNGAGDGESLQP